MSAGAKSESSRGGGSRGRRATDVRADTLVLDSADTLVLVLALVGRTSVYSLP